MDYRTSEESVALRKLIISGVLMMSMFAIGIFGYYFIGLFTDHDNWSILDCAYMTVITLSTVGYGEVISAEEPLFKFFTIFVILFGMGTTVFFTSTVTAFIVEGNLQSMVWRRKMEKQLAKMKDHIIVCGAGETGGHIIQELMKTNTPTVVIDTNEERLKTAYNRYNDNLPYIVGDAADDQNLIQAGIMRAVGLISACTDDKDNLFIIISARQLNPKLRIITKAVAKNSESKLLSAGADKVVTGTFISGMRMASEMLRPTVVTFLDKMLRTHDSTLRVEEVTIPPESRYAGKTIMEMEIRKKVGLAVMAVFDPDQKEYVFNPEANFKLKEGHVLVCMGEMDSFHKLRKIVQS